MTNIVNGNDDQTFDGNEMFELNDDAAGLASASSSFC